MGTLLNGEQAAAETSAEKTAEEPHETAESPKMTHLEGMTHQNDSSQNDSGNGETVAMETDQVLTTSAAEEQTTTDVTMEDVEPGTTTPARTPDQGTTDLIGQP